MRDLLRTSAVRGACGHAGHGGALGRTTAPDAPGPVPDPGVDGQAAQRRAHLGCRTRAPPAGPARLRPPEPLGDRLRPVPPDPRGARRAAVHPPEVLLAPA